ncbi:MAG: HAMP domain-containing sensor histidine kinase [Polyangiaceae bacterium]
MNGTFEGRRRWRALLVLAMIGSVVLVGTVALIDQRRQSEIAVRELASDQVVLAEAIATALTARLAAHECSDATQYDPSTNEPTLGCLLNEAKRLERQGQLMLLIRPEQRRDLLSTDGRAIVSTHVNDEIEKASLSIVLTRSEAVSFGLPARRAVAGISTIHTPNGQRWGLVALATAQHLRERQDRSDWRLALGVLSVAVAVFSFGGLALRQQRVELELAAELAQRTIEKERDQQLVRADKMATLAALSTGITHELATPLAVISTRLEAIEQKLKDDERGRKSTLIIREQIERIQRVMRGFLSIARGEAPVLEHTDSRTIVERAVALVRHRFDHAAVNLSVSLASERLVVAVNPPVFEQALVNLLLNACDASSSRAGSVTLSVDRHDDVVRFTVEDDGDGMPPDVAARATEPFFTTKPQGRGTGMGLAIANEIAKHHGGALSIESRAAEATQVSGPRFAESNERERTRGTRVTLSVPMARNTVLDG